MVGSSATRIRIFVYGFLRHRANRAQYAEVSFHSFVEQPDANCSNVPVVSLPSMQGTAEEEGKWPRARDLYLGIQLIS